jgi:hypothetical protein
MIDGHTERKGKSRDKTEHQVSIIDTVVTSSCLNKIYKWNISTFAFVRDKVIRTRMALVPGEP